jgi:hypothetical protein
VICLSELSSHILIPCGHICVCHLCVTTIGDKCPVCRQHVSSTHKTFSV